MVKQAKNLVRLLSRVGPNLAGATARDLKFLSRRGFSGFSPEQVAMLRSRGMLPTVQQELAGFNKGTKNMLRGVKVTRTDRPWLNPAGEYSARIHLTPDRRAVSTATVTIPRAAPSASLAEREARAAAARHEAREFVRERARVQKGYPALRTRARNDLLGAHAPGVLYDERLFRSQLANRLGLGKTWDQLPIYDGRRKPVPEDLDRKWYYRVAKPFGYDVNGAHAVMTRSPREVYIGNQPLSYTFRQIRDMLARQYAERDTLRDRLLLPLFQSRLPYFRQQLSAFKAKNQLRGSAYPSLPELTQNLKEYAAYPGYEAEIPRMGNMPGRARAAFDRMKETYRDRLYDIVAQRYGGQYGYRDGDHVYGIMHGMALPSLPEGSELAKLQGLSTEYPRFPVSPADDILH